MDGDIFFVSRKIIDEFIQLKSVYTDPEDIADEIWFSQALAELTAESVVKVLLSLGRPRDETQILPFQFIERLRAHAETAWGEEAIAAQYHRHLMFYGFYGLRKFKFTRGFKKKKLGAIKQARLTRLAIRARKRDMAKGMTREEAAKNWSASLFNRRRRAGGETPI